MNDFTHHISIGHYNNFFLFFLTEANYRHGRTFGDTTRQLDVCKHPFETYGEYLRRSRQETATEGKVNQIANSSKKINNNNGMQRMTTII